MPTWLSIILEIIKFTLPALVVFFTVRTMLEQHFNHQTRIKSLELSQQQQSTTLPLRLQAYERLSLFCERIAVPTLILRLREEHMTAAGFKVALMLGVQQEYEHNITQQVYVSDQLWQIIKIARDETIHFISLVAAEVDPKADAKALSDALFKYLAVQESSTLNTALLAVKKEAGVLLGNG